MVLVYLWPKSKKWSFRSLKYPCTNGGIMPCWFAMMYADIDWGFDSCLGSIGKHGLIPSSTVRWIFGGLFYTMLIGTPSKRGAWHPRMGIGPFLTFFIKVDRPWFLDDFWDWLCFYILGDHRPFLLFQIFMLNQWIAYFHSKMPLSVKACPLQFKEVNLSEQGHKIHSPPSRCYDSDKLTINWEGLLPIENSMPTWSWK